MRKIQVGLVAVMAILVIATTVALAVEVGDKAPDFELTSTKGGTLKLSSFLGKKNVLIEFYVLEFTPT